MADAATAEVSVLRDIAADRDAAMHFRVVSVLGRGGFGSVFKVWRAVIRVQPRPSSSRASWCACAGAMCSPATPEPAQAVRDEARRQLRGTVQVS